MYYNFLDLSPTCQRQVFRLICEFDLACNKLAQNLKSSTIAQVRQDQFLEGFRLVRAFVVAHGEQAIAKDLLSQNQDFIELNAFSQLFVAQYQHSLQSAKHWLIEVLEIPLWVVQQDIDEEATRQAAQHSDQSIAQFFATRCEGTKSPQLEAVA